MDFDDFPESEVSPIGSPTIEEIAEAHADVIAVLRTLDPMVTTATFGGLLAMPDLQANSFRIEALAHLAVAHCDGKIEPTEEFVRRSFEHLGEGYCGLMEDPTEDVFVSLVNTSHGNFRVFQGIREGTGFYLQRILNVVEGMPEGECYDRIRSSVESLLKLSDAVATRAGVRENDLGQELPLKALPASVAHRLSSAADIVRFSESDLARLQIPKAMLSEFVFSSGNRFELRAGRMGNTELERRPITVHDQSVHVLLPTAVASAITRFVIESALRMESAGAFEIALAGEFARLFTETPIVGGRFGAPIRFQRIAGGRIGALMTEVDSGRFLHLVFFVDGLVGFSHGGLSGANSDPDSLALAVTEHLNRASDHAKGQPGFRDGISLLVACGVGRGFLFNLEGDLPEHWRLESLGAHDLVTLSWLSDFDPLSLWRLLDAQTAINNQGIELVNLNGLLNLVAWSKQLGGHLVPHKQLPDGFLTPGSHGAIGVPQDAIGELRHSVLVAWNPRRVLDSDGRWVKVRKLSNSVFEEDKTAPLYGAEEDLPRLRGVYVASKRPWWIEISAPKDAPSEAVFDHWMMLCTWLRRAAPILDEAYTSLPMAPISYHVTFAELVGITHGPVKPKNADELRSLFQTFAKAGVPLVLVDVAEGFDDGLMQPENAAERAIVEVLVAGAAAVSGELADANKRARLVDRICPTSQARWMHRFEARSFRDFVHSEIDKKPLLIDAMDAAACRIGLGWRVRSRDSSPEVSGVSECTSYLNSVVRLVLDDLCAALKCLDRHTFVRVVLHNHEAAAHDRDVWNRTAQANVALHEDRDATVRTIQEH